MAWYDLDILLFGFLGIANLCCAIGSAFVFLRWSEPTPITQRLGNAHAGSEALCICMLVTDGCISLGLACLRAYQAGPSTSPVEWVTTACHVVAGCTNHATAFLFVRARLGGVVYAPPTLECGSQVWKDVEMNGLFEKY